MSDFEKMIQGLQEDMAVPDKVWKKYTDTLSNLPDKETSYQTPKRHWMKYAASAAAVVLTGIGACWMNPALAARIPIIGNIFGQVQDSIPFSGEYDDRATILSTENPAVVAADESVCRAESSGITLTASEIYCDGLSIFLTAEVEIEQGGLNSIPGNVIYLDGSWNTDEDTSKKQLLNGNLEGMSMDDNTFIGVLKLDLDSAEIQSSTVNLNLSMIGYDDVDALDAEDISAFHQIEGEWNLTLPFSVDTEAAKTFSMDLEHEGYHLTKVSVSPYQVVTDTDVPYTEKELSQKEFEEALKQKTGESAPSDFADDAELFAQMAINYRECHTLVLNQDGEVLAPIYESQGHSINAVQDMEISKLFIYVFDSFDAWINLKKNGIDSGAAEQAILSAEIDVN